MTARMKIAGLFRHPVKGLSPEPIAAARLEAGAYFPGDRIFAIENGPSGFDPAAPKWAPKIRYVMLMRDERLAEFITHYEDETSTLSIWQDRELVIEGDLSTLEGREAIAAFLAPLRRDDMHGPARLLAAPEGFRFTDSRSGFVSLINRASVEDIAADLGRAVDVRRFRGNILIEGLQAWDEFSFVGETLKIGDARLEVTKRIERCAATNVDPQTGARDMEIPHFLMRRHGHADCGVYARVIAGGRVGVGDAIEIEAPTLL